MADRSRPDTPLLTVRLLLNPPCRNGGLARRRQNNRSFPSASAVDRQAFKNECCQRSCSNCCGPISIETDRINLQQRFLAPIFGSIQVTLPHAAVAAAPAAGGGLGWGRPQRQALRLGLLLQHREHGAGRGAVGGACRSPCRKVQRHDRPRPLAAARRMA